jgi:membrane protein YdbS with pleckstrin-like domain
MSPVVHLPSKLIGANDTHPSCGVAVSVQLAPVWVAVSLGMDNRTLGPVAGMVDPARRPSRRAPLRWAVGGIFPWLLLAAGQLAWLGFDKRMPWLHTLIGVVTVLGVVVATAVVPVWRYRVHRWELGPQAVYTRTGWLVQERRIAPISRVQTVDTYRGPLDRVFGLANVTVTTASSAGAVHIVALDVDVADQLVAQLTDIAAIGAEDAT